MKIQSVALAALGLAAIASLGSAAGPKREGSTARMERATIKSLETDQPPIEVSFNPKELGVDKSVAWSFDPSSTEADPAVQFVGPASRTLSVPLIMADKVDVRPLVALLMNLALVDDGTHRPPLLTFAYGGLPKFTGVIESIGTKYTMFLPDGTPVRAQVGFRMREANRASIRRNCTQDSDCPDGQVCVQLICQAR